MIRNILAETLDRVSRNLALRPNYTMEEYQRWFDQNPEYMHNGAMQHIQLVEPLTLEGTNNLYRAQFWLEHPNDSSRYVEQEIVVKICKFWATPGKNRLHFIEHGLPESHRRFPNFQGQDRADGILRQFRFANARLHFCARFRIRAANRRSFYGFCRHLRKIHMGIHLAHGLHPAQNLRSAGGFQNLVRHGARRNPSEGFPCRRTPAPPIIAKAVF